jgi:hypothetical protein
MAGGVMEKGKFWGPIPVYVLQDHRHRGAHLRVLGAILSCPAPHFPSLKEIAERSGHTPKYCSNVVSDLVSFGTIESVKEKHNIQGFGYFCSLYPRHRLGSVNKLREHWISNTLESKHKEICDSVKEFKLREWGTQNGKFVPGAFKFLDEERWTTLEDECDPMQQFYSDNRES